MNILPKKLSNEKYEYASGKPLEEFREDMENLFSKNIFDVSMNITGRFTSHDTFKITNRGSFVDARGYNAMASCIKGVISQNKDNQTVVLFVVKSDTIFKIFFLLCPLIGLITVGANLKNSSPWKLFEIGIFMILIVPLCMLAMSDFSKREIKIKFVAFFELRPLE